MKILSVDLQNEFSMAGGLMYRPRPCVPFIQATLLPFVREQGYTVAEIISDYRVTAPATGTDTCVPGQWGYQSLIPADVKHPWVWVKAEPSPAWIRKGGGEAETPPGVPYPAPHAFSKWLIDTIGPPTQENEIVIVGLMLEICVLATLQELHHRGYRAKVLFEGVDTYSSSTQQKQLLFEILFPFWGQALYWQEIYTSTK
jgi:nicotinamidase-related amidase